MWLSDSHQKKKRKKWGKRKVFYILVLSLKLCTFTSKLNRYVCVQTFDLCSKYFVRPEDKGSIFLVEMMLSVCRTRYDRLLRSQQQHLHEDISKTKLTFSFSRLSFCAAAAKPAWQPVWLSAAGMQLEPASYTHIHTVQHHTKALFGFGEWSREVWPLVPPNSVARVPWQPCGPAGDSLSSSATVAMATPHGAPADQRDGRPVD